MSRIYLDSMVFVYWLEEHPVYAERVSALLARVEARGDTLCTSTFTLGEVLAGPLKRGRHDIAAQVTAALRPPFVELLSFDPGTARLFAQIRATTSVSAADAIHLSSAAQSGTSLFLTNDRKLHTQAIPGIDFIAGLDVNLF